MSEERLKEIKNIFDIADIYGDDFEIARELYNEVIRLRKKLAIKKLFKKHNVQTPENFEIRKIFELQQRIEKAVEYIENNDFGIITFSDRDINGNLVIKIEKGYVKKDELLNILNGRE